MVPIGWLYITYHLLGEPETTIDEMSLKSKYYMKKVRVLSTIILFFIPSGLMFNPSAKTMKPIKRVLFFLKIEKIAFQIAAENCCPGDGAGTRREITKKQQSTVGAASVPWCSVLLYNMSHSKPNHRILDGFDKNISPTQKTMVCYISKWVLH